MAKIRHLNLKAHSNNVEIQSDKILTTQISFLLLQSRWDFILMKLGKKLTKRRNNEPKFKYQSILFKPNIFKRPGNH